MAGACYGALRLIPPTESVTNQLARVFVPLLVAAVIYFAVYRACRGPEIRMLVGGFDAGKRADEGAYSDDMDG
jgi:hypothetical protein